MIQTNYVFEKQKYLKNENLTLRGIVYKVCPIMYDTIFSLNNVWLKIISQTMHIYRRLWFEFSLTKFYMNKNCLISMKQLLVSIECTASWYGDQCNHSCGYCLNGAPCFHVSGSCDHGCQSGYQVPYCIEGT